MTGTQGERADENAAEEKKKHESNFRALIARFYRACLLRLYYKVITHKVLRPGAQMRSVYTSRSITALIDKV